MHVFRFFPVILNITHNKTCMIYFENIYLHAIFFKLFCLYDKRITFLSTFELFLFMMTYWKLLYDIIISLARNTDMWLDKMLLTNLQLYTRDYTFNYWIKYNFVIREYRVRKIRSAHCISFRACSTIHDALNMFNCDVD